jgi:O-phosphoseryl-tRNA(Cys) synthetase
MAGPDNWYYIWEVGFPFSTERLQSSYKRKDFETAWKEGTEFVKECANNGISVSLRVRDTRQNYFALNLEERLTRG